MQTECPAHLKRHYFGMVVENFTCDPELNEPISALFGDYLFYHIVDSPATASEILKLYNASESKGQVFFFALSSMADVDPNTEPPSPFVESLTYDATYDKVFRFICDEAPNNDELDAGDLFDADMAAFIQNGAFLNADVGPSRKCIYARDGAFLAMDLDASSKCIQWYQRYRELRTEIDGINRELLDSQQSLGTVDDDLKKALDAFKKAKERSTLVVGESAGLARLREQIKTAEKKVEAKETTLGKHKTKLQSLKETLERLTKELTLPLLAEPAKKLVDAIDAELAEVCTEDGRVRLEMQTFEAERVHLQNDMQTNLLRRHDALEDQLSAYSENVTECTRNERQIERLTAQLTDSSRDQASAVAQLTELNATVVTLNKELDEWKQKKADAQAQQQSFMKEQATLERQKSELVDKLSKLVGEAANARAKVSAADHTTLTEGEVSQELQIARQHVRSYRANHHFDNDLLATMRLEKGRLEARRDELHEHGKCIEKAILEHEQKMHGALSDTLRDVQMRFSRLFGTFVENGTATIEMKSEQLHEHGHGKEHTVGLSMTASFGAKALDFEKLAPPERKVVTLAFILTIQQLNGAPFFLFDCVDRVSFGRGSSLKGKDLIFTDFPGLSGHTRDISSHVVRVYGPIGRQTSNYRGH